MKYIISEKQLAKLILKQKDVDEQTDGSETSISTANSTSSSTSSEDSGENGSSMSADEYPAYPETGKWESGIERGHANPLGVTKWESGIERGHANPLKEIENEELSLRRPTNMSQGFVK